MKSSKLFASLLATAILAASLTGCAVKTTDTQKADITKIDTDQTINIIGYDYTSLDPSKVSDAESFTALTNIMEGLVRENFVNGKTVNELAGAKEIKKSSDGTVYTFTLRDGVKWSDGKPVTAEDYVYSWKRLVDKNVSQDYIGFLEEIGVKGAKEATSKTGSPDDLQVKAVNDKTFEVILTAPNAYFESALAFKGLVPQREDTVKKLGDQYGVDYKNMVFDGPFIISDYEKGSKVVYTKNDKYWDADNVKLKTANALIIDEPATFNKMFDSRELDMISGTGDYLAKLKTRSENKEIQYVHSNAPAVGYYTYNTNSSILKNAKVRLALSLAYDRQTQINTVWKKYTPAMGIVPQKIMLGSDEYRQVVPEPLKTVKEDPEKLLSEGLNELNITDTSKVTLKLLTGPATSSTQTQAQFIQNQLQNNLGIKIDIKYSADGPSYMKDWSNGNFDICSGSWGADYNDVISFFNLFTTDNGNNSGKYSNPKYDELVKKGMTEADSKKRLSYFKEAENLLVAEDAAVSPFLYIDNHTFIQNYLKGMYIPLFGGHYDLKHVYVQGK